jgi:hypothetical protein
MLRHDHVPVNLKPETAPRVPHPKIALFAILGGMFHPDSKIRRVASVLSSRPEEIIAKAMICGVEGPCV